MATITLEIGRKNKKSVRPVSFIIRQGKDQKRIPTEISVSDSELSSNGKKIKNLVKARIIEEMRNKLQMSLFELSYELAGREVGAAYIAKRLTAQHSSLDFFKFAEDWLEHSTIKGKKNYYTMLNTLEGFLHERVLPFSQINFSMLTDFERFLKDKPRAQSLYLGQMRHLYREAMRQHNDEHTNVIKYDPFTRYKVPRQQIKKGVRSLSLEELMRIYHFTGNPHSRAQLARDVFILSFCLMGMNSVDLYGCKDMKHDTIRYNRAKTKDRRSDAAYIEVKVHPFIGELVKKYRGRTHVFNFHERYSSPTDFNRALNIGLKEVGREIGIDNLQFYQARHTFANLSRNLMRFSKSDVDEALNHVGSFDVADIYITKDFSIINENNFKLIERVFGLKREDAITHTNTDIGFNLLGRESATIATDDADMEAFLFAG